MQTIYMTKEKRERWGPILKTIHEFGNFIKTKVGQVTVGIDELLALEISDEVNAALLDDDGNKAGEAPSRLVQFVFCEPAQDWIVKLPVLLVKGSGRSNMFFSAVLGDE